MSTTVPHLTATCCAYTSPILGPAASCGPAPSCMVAQRLTLDASSTCPFHLADDDESPRLTLGHISPDAGRRVPAVAFLHRSTSGSRPELCALAPFATNLGTAQLALERLIHVVFFAGIENRNFKHLQGIPPLLRTLVVHCSTPAPCLEREDQRRDVPVGNGWAERVPDFDISDGQRDEKDKSTRRLG